MHGDFRFACGMETRFWVKGFLSLLILCGLSGCIAKRTVTQGSYVKEEKTVFIRPIKNMIRNSR